MVSPASPGQRYVQILRLPAVCRTTGLGRSTVYQLEATNRFPRRIKIGARAVGWIEAEIQSWLADRITTSRGSAVRAFEGSDAAQRFARISTSQVSPR